MNSCNGFSMIEILVALTLAAILSITFLGVQRQNALMAQASADTWQTLNLSQDVLAHKYPDGFNVISSGWISWPGPPAGKIRTTLNTISGLGVGIYSLETETSDYSMTWHIYRVSRRTLDNR